MDDPERPTGQREVGHSSLVNRTSQRVLVYRRERGESLQKCVVVSYCLFKLYESGREDLNLRPHGPEPCALAKLSYAP